MGKIERFEDIEAWQEGCQLVERIYEITTNDAFARDLNLKDQIRRAAISIPSNIAEGYERGSKKELIHFLYIAKGSAGELRTQIHIAEKLRYLSRTECEEISQHVQYISRLIANFIKYLKNS